MRPHGRAKVFRDCARFGFLNAKMHNLPLFHLFWVSFQFLCWFWGHLACAKRLNGNIGRAKKFAFRRSGHQLPPTGHLLATYGPPTGHHMVTKWTPYSHQLATKWQPTGHLLATHKLLTENNVNHPVILLCLLLLNPHFQTLKKSCYRKS